MAIDFLLLDAVNRVTLAPLTPAGQGVTPLISLITQSSGGDYSAWVQAADVAFARAAWAAARRATGTRGPEQDT